jgi:methylglyoxal synthase
LIAHDGKKDEIVRLVQAHEETLRGFDVVATGTTGERIIQATSVRLRRLRSGPYGGDAQIAAMVADGLVVAVVFMVDPLYAHPHEPDIQGLLRICNVYNVPLATNEATAHLILKGLAAASERKGDRPPQAAAQQAVGEAAAQAGGPAAGHAAAEAVGKPGKKKDGEKKTKKAEKKAD